MKTIILATLGISALLAGCVTQPTMTRDDWLNTTTRTYTSVSKDRVLAAAEKLFYLADGKDFQISHSEEGMHATRNWSVYLVIGGAMGTDYWRVTARNVNGKVKTAVQVNTQSQTIQPMMTTSGAWTATTSQMMGNPVQGTAVYDVFWARMDYLLGKRADWMTCEQANARVKQRITWGTNEALCNSFNIKDFRPGETAASRSKRLDQELIH